MTGMAYFKGYPERFFSGVRGLSKANQAYYALILWNLYAEGVGEVSTDAARAWTGLKPDRFAKLLDALAAKGCVDVVGDRVRQGHVARQCEGYRAGSSARSERAKGARRARASSEPLRDKMGTTSGQDGNHLGTTSGQPPPEAIENNRNSKAYAFPPNQNQNQKPAAAASIDEKEGAPPPDWQALITAFDRAIVTAFGQAEARPWPAAADSGTAIAMLADGAAAEAVERVATGICMRRKAQGQAAPGTLAYVRKAVAEDAARAGATAAPAKPTREVTIRDYCLLWADGLAWPSHLGPAPDQDGCMALDQDLIDAADSTDPNRDRQRCEFLKRKFGLTDPPNPFRYAVVQGGAAQKG